MTVGNAACERLRVALYGAVQGVGFRPFVYRLATELGLAGWVLNSAAGLVAEVEGPAELLPRFLQRLEAEQPAAAVVLARETVRLAPAGFTRFEVVASEEASSRTAAILPDLATCPQCLAEIADPADRRYRYPFTNCTQCGPRYSIILDIPYDRPRTTMAEFELCPECRREYTDPADRRFHAQPVACPQCGPRLSASLEEAARVLRTGRILALKGIGGFQLLADARQEDAVVRLRRLKRREEKPFALMAPSLPVARELCHISPAEERALCSAAAPHRPPPPARGHRHRTRGGALLPLAGRHASLFAPAPSAPARGRVPRGGHQRQPQRRAHRHR